ncbi:gamma-glutamyl hydrolase-like [Culicoides brevitarsis]|uniref:gamma-glutamyl hydrolase-like n=1 Tax=Culicoides brevitarsis TaxID=469753 RepID=UPI00307B71CD
MNVPKMSLFNYFSLFCLIFSLTGSFGAINFTTSSPVVNEYPIVGVLAQEIAYSLEQKYPGQYKSFIAASYVKFVEGGGARVIPIFIDRPKSYYEEIMRKVNGILFPGGATWFNQSNGYADAGMFIYNIAKELNDNGTYFPIWGTCLGFELLTYLDSNATEHRDDCSSHNQALHLDFKADALSSRLFSVAPKEVIEDLRTKPVTSNFHQYCVTEKAMKEAQIAENWRVMSTNLDWNGFEFISTIEHVKYPFYGVQFHPEKNLYEWIRNKNITHTKESTRTSQYFAEFFVDECRRSKNNFNGNSTEEDLYMIYNFPLTFTGKRKSSYEECYLFKADVDYFNGAKSVAIGFGVLLLSTVHVWI